MHETCATYRGRIIHSFSSLEVNIDFCIADFYGDKRADELLVLMARNDSILSFGSKRSILSDIIYRHYPDFIKDAKNIYLKQIDSLSSFRNKVAHLRMEADPNKYDGDLINLIATKTNKKGQLFHIRHHLTKRGVEDYMEKCQVVSEQTRELHEMIKSRD